ncbi:hypothetical protein [Bradyrhizobium aeschynomenes]|uniref:hypothetical protein n=1 Tax=Bradyrhizobium aeschynomenes TaxID=2734909 RepID=UPI00289662A2|nr:hypothetical protein [Bradyrhizobium aeschynomenes]
MFYSHGFGLFGRLSVSLALGVGVIVYILQAVTSWRWLAHFALVRSNAVAQPDAWHTPADTDGLAVGGCETRACLERCHWSGMVASDCSQSAPYFPGHTGLRFSANAFRPSLASSVIASSAI